MSVGFLAVAITLLPYISAAHPLTPMISYTLQMPKPATHVFEVQLDFEGLDSHDSILDVALPVWRSGRYVVLDFAGGVLEFSAVDASSKAFSWSKTDKATWRIEKGNATVVRVRYSVFANEFSMRTRGLNDEHAFVDAAAVFMYAKKYVDCPIALQIIPFGNWHVTTGLEHTAGSKNKFVARNYEHLADCPFEIGTQKDFEFAVEGKNHVLSIFGDGNYVIDSLIKDITTIVQLNAKFWGKLPYDRYVFLLALSPSGRGGTEHLNSCVLATSPFVFSNPDSYRGFLGLVSHEYFHTWNVKQFRPSGFDTYDWSRENYVKELWIAEGATSYYDELLLVRAGLTSEQKYLEQLASSINADIVRPGNARQSLVESSFDAWIKYWKEGEHAYNFETDYYGRGAAVSFALDLTIRKQTQNKKTLDDVMRRMFERYLPGEGGYTVLDFRKTAEEVAGTDLAEFFANYVEGVASIPWKKLLGVFGLELEPKKAEEQPWLGIGTMDEGQRTRVTSVIAGSPAYEAGVDVNDEVLALNGYRVRSADLRARIGELKEGDVVRLTLFRDSRLRDFQITLKNPAHVEVKIVKSVSSAEAQSSAYRSWLGLPPETK